VRAPTRRELSPELSEEQSGSTGCAPVSPIHQSAHQVARFGRDIRLLFPQETERAVARRQPLDKLIIASPARTSPRTVGAAASTRVAGWGSPCPVAPDEDRHSALSTHTAGLHCGLRVRTDREHPWFCIRIALLVPMERTTSSRFPSRRSGSTPPPGSPARTHPRSLSHRRDRSPHRRKRCRIVRVRMRDPPTSVRARRSPDA